MSLSFLRKGAKHNHFGGLLLKYKDWLKEWLNYCIKPTTEERTYDKYCRIVENHINTVLGDYDERVDGKLTATFYS